MDPVPIFLNDASYPLISADDPQIHSEIVLMLHTLREIKLLNRSVVFGAAMKLSDISVDNAYRTLASFANVVDVEWWRFIRGLDLHAPFSLVPRSLAPDYGKHATGTFAGAQAVLWALSNDSFLVSFSSSDDWRQPEVNFALCSCGDDNHRPMSVLCKNMSEPEHVRHWRSNILDFHMDQAASSTIYESNQFRLKMYLNDHEPPHVHVYLPGYSQKCVGKIRLDCVEVLEDDGLTGSLRRSLMPFISGRRDEFLRAWERCREGQLPNVIGD